MATAEPKAHDLRRGFGVGALIVFAIVLMAALALGAEVWIAVLVGAFVGLFVGGGLGLLIAGRAAAESD